jgi:putative membrane protein
VIAFLTLGIVLLFVASIFWLLPTSMTVLETLGFLMTMMILGFVFPRFVPAYRMAMVGPNTVERRVLQRASEAFLEREVFKTEKRIGILLFISTMERRAVILADAGINQKVQQHEWQSIIDQLTADIKNDNTADGICEAITRCRLLLVQKGFTNDANAGNQLPDGLVEGH